MLKKINIKEYHFRDITSLGSFFITSLILLLVLVLQEYNLFYRLLFGLIFTLVGVVAIRTFYFKNRPKKENYKNYIGKLEASSFPSLHTARMIFLALIFSFHFKQIQMTLFFIFIALITMYSRIHLKKHDWVDLTGGVVLGIITFYLTTIF
jgi:membrane-associated phospholipid phosphatase